jgi:ABC-type multidrug transport system fused ATPase/permease subunit
MEKVFEVLEYEPKIRNDTGEELNTLSGHFEFINVSFSYPSAPNV